MLYEVITHACREERREEVALFQPGDVAVQFDGKTIGVMALRKGNRGRDLAGQLVLLQQPRLVEIPPLGAVEDEIETGLRGVFRLVGGAPEP